MRTGVIVMVEQRFGFHRARIELVPIVVLLLLLLLIHRRIDQRDAQGDQPMLERMPLAGRSSELGEQTVGAKVHRVDGGRGVGAGLTVPAGADDGFLGAQIALQNIHGKSD